MSWLPIVAGIAGLASILGVAYAVFTSSKTAKLLDLYKAEAEAEKIRGDRLDRDNTALQLRVNGLEEANKVLVENISGTLAMKELETAIHTWRTEESGLLDSIINKLGSIIDALPKRQHDDKKLDDAVGKLQQILEHLEAA